MPAIWLVGMMGSGKSTVAPLVAARLGWEWVDTDQRLGAQGRTAGEWLGEDPGGFREAERRLVSALADGRDRVVACGGGVVLDTEAVERMRRTGLVVWLDAPTGVLARRVGDGSGRPLLHGDPATALDRIRDERADRYRSAAHLTVAASGSPLQVAAAVVEHWLSPDSGAGQVWIGRGPGVPEAIVTAHPSRRIVFLVQSGVPEAVAGRIAEAIGDRETTALVLPDGEAAKTMGVAEGVMHRLEAAGVDRDDLLVGVGGGALTDLAGFVAAVYRRGVPLCLVPTTLVAAIDAAIGGKSGLNLEAKNQIGAFRHPQRVVIDLDTLEGLPPRLRREGLSEALKAGLVGDPGLVDLFERHGSAAPLAEVVTGAIRVKAGIVSRDFRDTAERAHLNYGHTVGHAVERASGLSHGEAVAVGMVAAARASALVAGFTAEERQRAVIARLGLPVSAPGLDPAGVLRLMGRDKKRVGGDLRMVLLEEIGRPRVAVVDDATVTAALAAVGIGGDAG